MTKPQSSAHGTAVITGASSGIGKVYADRFASRGYDLLLVARRGDRLKEISEDLHTRYQVRVEFLIADLAHPKSLMDVAQRLRSDSSITLLVNNAGTGSVKPLVDTSLEDLNNMVALNITALSTLTMAVLPEFLKRNSGTIINLGSSSGYAPHPFAPIYGPTKAYVLQFTRTLLQDLAGTAIRIQLVTPAVTITEMWDVVQYPVSKFDPAIMMTAEDCVDAALRGLDLRETITAPSLQNDDVLKRFEITSEELFRTMRLTGRPAPRYKPEL